MGFCNIAIVKPARLKTQLKNWSVKVKLFWTALSIDRSNFHNCAFVETFEVLLFIVTLVIYLSTFGTLLSTKPG